MADGRFVYEVTIDGATAQQAARRLRDVFEKELTQAGESAASVSVRQTTDRAALQAVKQTEREKVNAAREAAREQTALAREAAKEAAQAAREAATAVKRADQDETSSAGAAARSRAIAAKMAADEAAAAARAAAAAVRRADEEGAQSARAAAQERAAAARQAADQTIAAAKEAARAQGAAQQQARGGRTLGGTLRSIDNLLAFGVGGLAGYGAVQAGQQLYGAGRAGAGMERTTLALEQSARDLNVSAQAMVRAIQEGSRGTVAQSEAQSMSLQLLSQKWASQRPDIAGDAQLIAQAARLFSQRYVTAEGQPMSSSEVVGRLLGYIREGNKELIDQFGFNNAMVAKAAGVPNENLTSADRARGLFKILAEEVNRFGDVTETNAEKIQRAEVAFSDAMDRIKVALAGPTAAAATFTADLLEGFQRGTVTRDPNGRFTPEQMRTIAGEAAQMQRQEPPKTWGGPEVQAARLEEYKKAVEAIADAQAKGYGPANAWADAIKAASSELDYFNVISDENAQAVALINAAYAEEKPLIDSLAAAHGDAAAAAADEAAAVEKAESALANFLTKVGETNTQLLALARQMAAGMTLNVGMNVTANTVWQDAIDQYGKTLTLPNRATVPISPFAGTTTGESIRALGGNQTGLMPNPSAEARRQDMYDVWDLRAQQRREAEQAAQAAQRDWESAADKTQKAFEQAAEDAAQAFKSNLEKIPGLFGTSDVTAQDMEDAKAGIYKEKPDEYLRQLRDEVLNKKDYPGVDLADIASVAGIDQSLSPEAQLRLIERKWNDSSLFANPEALRFINKDAVDAFQADQAASAAGRTNLLSFFGLGADSPLAPAEKDAFAQMIGLDDPTEIQAAARTAKETFAAEFAKPATEGGTNSGAAFVQELVGSLDADLIGGDVLKTLNGVGEGILGAIKAGYDKAASEGDWSTPVVASLAEQVLPMVLQAVEDNL